MEIQTYASQGSERAYIQMYRSEAVQLGLMKCIGRSARIQASRDFAGWRAEQGIRMPIDLLTFHVRFNFPDVDTAVAFKLVWL